MQRSGDAGSVADSFDTWASRVGANRICFYYCELPLKKYSSRGSPPSGTCIPAQTLYAWLRATITLRHAQQSRLLLGCIKICFNVALGDLVH